MHLPPGIRRLIEGRAEAIGFAALKRAAGVMSDAYREGSPGATRRLAPAERAAAYLVTRMPATYAAAWRALGEVRRRLEARPVSSILDVGAGTGAASLAARHWFPDASLTLLERDGAFADAARECLPGARLRLETFHAWKPFRRTTWWWRPTPSTNFRPRWAPDCGAPRGLRWSGSSRVRPPDSPASGNSAESCSARAPA